MSIMQAVLRKLQRGERLCCREAETVFAAIMKGEATPAQIGAVLMGLSVRGETPEVVAGAARAMRRAATRIQPKTHDLIDTCGTGGDAAATFNISTAAAFVVAACGQPVAKHGNRAISSKCGSADVLEALGVRLDLPPAKVADCIDEIGIGFLFAPAHHPAMKHAAGPRRELGVRTIFNLLGPLTNPAGAAYQIVGVFAEDRLPLMAAALQRLGVKRALVVHGRDGLDEVTTTDLTDAVLVEGDSSTRRFEIDAAAFGMPRAEPRALAGGDAPANAEIIRRVLAGERDARRDIVLLNAACALWVAGRASGIPEGIAMAADAVDTGRAQRILNDLIDFTRSA